MVKKVLRVEGAVVCATCLYVLFVHLNAPWWVLPIFVLGPDASMIGYALNPRIGAVLYNLAHTFILAVPVTLVGWQTENHFTLVAGLILTGHIGMDRAFGYGLKYPTAFKDTHFGRV